MLHQSIKSKSIFQATYICPYTCMYTQVPILHTLFINSFHACGVEADIANYKYAAHLYISERGVSTLLVFTSATTSLVFLHCLSSLQLLLHSHVVLWRQTYSYAAQLSKSKSSPSASIFHACHYYFIVPPIDQNGIITMYEVLYQPGDI